MTARLQKHARLAGLGARRFTMRSSLVVTAVARAITGHGIASIMAAIGWKYMTVATTYAGGRLHAGESARREAGPSNLGAVSTLTWRRRSRVGT